MPGFNYLNYADMAQNAFQQGRQYAKQKGVENALALYEKDPAASQTALIGMGAFDEAKQIQGARQTQTREKVGQMAAGGDIAGAQKAALSSGDFDTYGELAKLPDSQRQQAIAAITETAQIGAALKASMPIDPNNPQAALDARKQRAMQLAPQFGIDPNEVAKWDFSDQSLDAHTVEAQKLATMKPEDFTTSVTGSHILRFSNQQAAPVYSYDAPQYKTVADGSSLVQVGGDGSGAQPAAQGGGLGQGGFEAIYQGFTAPHEGGYTAQDGNGQPANFGINQGANPDVDVKNLTPDAAAKIMHDRYWVPSGADNLPPALQAIQFDTAVNMGVGAANDLLQKSGGDPQKYLQLREDRFKSIAVHDPSKAASLPNWLQRNQDLAAYVGGGGQASGQGGAKVLYHADKASASTQTNLSPEALDVAADYYNSTGLMPTMGQGGAAAANRAAVMNRAAEKKSGNNLALSSADNKANSQTLTALSKQRGSVSGYEKTVQANLDIVNQLLDKGPGPTGRPVIDRVAQHIRKEYAGDPEVTAYESALQTVISEYAKVMSGSMGNTAVSDSARNHAEKLLNTSLSREQIKANIAVMRQEMSNRINGMDAEIENVRSHIGQNGDDPAAQATQQPKVGNDVQMRAYRQHFKPGAAYGSADNPLILREQDADAGFARLQAGQYFIAPDGSLRQK